MDTFKSYWPVVVGVILLVVVTFRPDGLLSFIVSRRERIGTFGSEKQNEKSEEYCLGLRMAILEIKNVGKTFGNLKALDGINISVKENTFHGLIGPNGSGVLCLKQLPAIIMPIKAL